MKKLPITKEAFEKSRYFKSKYGKLEYVSESGKVFKTDKGKILKFKESNERMSDNEAQINDFLEKIGDYLMSDYGVDDVEKYRFGDRIIVEYNGASYYVEVGLTDNQPAQEGTESNPRFKCMENRRSKRR